MNIAIARILLLGFVLSFTVSVRAQVSPEKRAEIDSLIRVTGLEQLMGQMKDQMLATLKSNPDVSAAMLKRMSDKLVIRDVLEKIIPIYDKYYSIEDLKAINAFYASAAGQRVLKTLPQVMQESVAAGQAWGQKAAREVEAEMTIEAQKKRKGE
jgi:uncharacterized protein